jgi:hypothetical protein
MVCMLLMQILFDISNKTWSMSMNISTEHDAIFVCSHQHIPNIYLSINQCILPERFIYSQKLQFHTMGKIHYAWVHKLRHSFLVPSQSHHPSYPNNIKLWKLKKHIFLLLKFHTLNSKGDHKLLLIGQNKLYLYHH